MQNGIVEYAERMDDNKHLQPKIQLLIFQQKIFVENSIVYSIMPLNNCVYCTGFLNLNRISSEMLRNKGTFFEWILMR